MPRINTAGNWVTDGSLVFNPVKAIPVLNEAGTYVEPAFGAPEPPEPVETILPPTAARTISSVNASYISAVDGVGPVYEDPISWIACGLDDSEFFIAQRFLSFDTTGINLGVGQLESAILRMTPIEIYGDVPVDIKLYNWPAGGVVRDLFILRDQLDALTTMATGSLTDNGANVEYAFDITEALSTAGNQNRLALVAIASNQAGETPPTADNSVLVRLSEISLKIVSQ